jgi:hypothetical protein
MHPERSGSYQISDIIPLFVFFPLYWIPTGMNFLKRFPIHPLLFGIYPALALMGYNLGQILPGTAFRSVWVTLLIAIALYALAWLIFRDPQRAALAASLLLILFYSYGQVYDGLSTVSPGGFVLGRHRYLFPLWAILAVIGLVLIWRAKKDLRQMNSILTAIAAVAVFFPLFQLGSYEVRVQAAEKQMRSKLAGVNSQQADSQIKPDIYYIILDGYARHDVMKNDWRFDDSEFEDGLRSLGFVIAECSQSNYPQTELSIPATLNMEWVPEMCPDCKPGTKDFSQLWAATQHNAVRSFLENQGYTTVSFETGFPWSEWRDADHYFKADPSMVEKGSSTGQHLNAFEAMLTKTTALRPIIDIQTTDQKKNKGKQKASALDVDRFPNFMFRVRVLNTLAHMETASTEIESPKLVYAHIISPHTPYVFGKHGEMIDLVDSELSGDAYARAYTDQAYYVSMQVLALVRKIIETSDQPPIIIIQSDHGNSHERVDRLKNLSAFYLPYGRGQLVYPTITNINTFRILFDAYFNTNYGRLEDQSYLSYPEDPFKLEQVPVSANTCPAK